MKTYPHVIPLKVGNVDFLVSSAIDRCPSFMMVRELTMNAIEAAANDKSGLGKVRIKAKYFPDYPGVRKLTFWNNGPGMSSAQLSHICDIAASLKNMGLDANFGMGAKVASLSVNQLGMRYRSCKGGNVSQVVLAKVNGVYGKLQFDIDGTAEDVLDVTEKVRKENEYSTESDWTEVVLLGNSWEQDTVSDPFGDASTNVQWLADALYFRFYSIPENVEIVLEEEVHKLHGERKFKTIPQRKHKFGKVETIPLDNGIKIHYYWDPLYDSKESHNKSFSGHITTAPSTVGVVFKGELYDVRRSKQWYSIAPEFGVPFAARHVSIHVELPDDFPVVPEAYRRFIQLSEGDQHQVNVTEFANIARDYRPAWLVELIKSFGPRPSISAEKIENELQKLLNELSIKTKAPRLNSEGQKEVNEGIGRGEGDQPQNENVGPRPNPNPPMAPSRYFEAIGGVKRASCALTRDVAPKIQFLDQESEIIDHDLLDKLAKFYDETNELFINTHYSAIKSIGEYLEKQFAGADVEDPDQIKTLAMKIGTNIATVRSGRIVVYAKAKLILQTWSKAEALNACRPECLSVVCDDWGDLAESACSEMRKQLGLSVRQVKSIRVIV